MKGKIKSSIFLTVLLLIGCGNVTEMPISKATLFLLPKDLYEQKIVSKYDVIRNKKGLENLYISNENSGFELAILCGVNFKQEGMPTNVSIRTQISKPSSLERAKELFKINAKIGAFYKNSIKSLDAKTYVAEETFCIEDASRFYLALRSGRIVVTFDIEDLKINEIQLNGILKEKFENIVSHYSKE